MLNALNLFANYGVASWLPTLLVQNGWSLPDASRVMAVLALGAIPGCIFVSRQHMEGRKNPSYRLCLSLVQNDLKTVQNFQRKAGLEPADGYAGLKVLARLRQGI